MASYELRILLLISLSYLVGYSFSKSCHAKDKNPYRLFASKTGYNQVRATNTSKAKYPGCTPIQFYFISRHGTRFPKAEDIKRMRRRLPAIRDLIVIAAANNKGKLCKDDLTNLKNWNFQLSDLQDNKLAPTGKKELRGVGMRYRARFLDFFNKLEAHTNLDLRSTTTDRTQDSAQFFVQGLYGNESLQPLIVDDDTLLRFYKNCQLWKQMVNKNAEALMEATNFRNGSRMTCMINDVRKRLGVTTLSVKDVLLIYDNCRFEAALEEDVISPWCAAFESDDLKILEYAEDIKYYYKHGYGHAINYHQACLPVKDIVDKFVTKMNGNYSEAVVVRFTHSGMMLKLLSRLGLFKDVVALTSANYKKQKERSWRTSCIDSFAANLALMLLDCKFEYRVAAFFQEKEINLPGCSSSPCVMPEFLQAFSKFSDNCDVNKICDQADKSKL